MSSDEHRCLIEDVKAMLGRAKLPKLEPNCCIYKVPQKMRERNPVAYTPQVVSIGPLHHGDERLKPMEHLKVGYMKCYLERDWSTNMKLEDCIGKLKGKEEYIRGCYADTISQNSDGDDFIKMILIDACFLIEYFLRCSKSSQLEANDPIVSIPCKRHDVDLDLILLENQLPFFVLEDLITLTGKISSKQFLEEIFEYFRKTHGTIRYGTNHKFTFDYFCNHQLKAIDGGYMGDKVQHFTDMLRFFLLPCQELRRQEEVQSERLKYSASQLMEAGLKLRVSEKTENRSLIELHFKDGELTMPQFLIDYNTEILLRNIAAFEQCHYPDETPICDYLILLDFLINERKDVDILVQKGVMVHILGVSDKVVANLLYLMISAWVWLQKEVLIIAKSAKI